MTGRRVFMSHLRHRFRILQSKRLLEQSLEPLFQNMTEIFIAFIFWEEALCPWQLYVTVRFRKMSYVTVSKILVTVIFWINAVYDCHNNVCDCHILKQWFQWFLQQSLRLVFSERMIQGTVIFWKHSLYYCRNNLSARHILHATVTTMFAPVIFRKHALYDF